MAMIPLDSIAANSASQLRAADSKATVQEYVSALNEGAVFPPVVVFCDDNGRHWLADGFHRYEAHKAAGREDIAAEVHAGGQREAILFAAGANAAHGLRRTQEDKRKAILTLLEDPEWRTWSDREIARATSTDHKTVGKLRREISGEGGEIPTRAESGEIPTRRAADAKPSGLFEKVLAGMPDEALLAEVRRRGLLEGAQ